MDVGFATLNPKLKLLDPISRTLYPNL